MNRPAPILVAVLLALSTVGSGLAAQAAGPDPRLALHQAFVHNLALKSYRATMTNLKTNQIVATLEFQAPDRFRMQPMGQAPMVIVGDTMYMSQNGRSFKVPLPRNMLGQFRNEAAISALESGTSVRALGPGKVGAEPAMKYAFDSSQGGGESRSTAWIGVRSKHVLMVETTGKAGGREQSMRIVYSDFDSPAIRIVPPK